MISFDDMVEILKAIKNDKWGISAVSDEPIHKECKIMYSLKNEELKNGMGEYVAVTAKVYFEGLYDINFSDRLSFIDDFGKKHNMEILAIKPIKDFSNNVLYTRVTV